MTLARASSGKSHRESVFHIDCTYRYAFHQMDQDSFDQCTVDPAGGSLRPEYFMNMREYHFLFCGIFIFSGVLGLLVSYYTNVATGPMIVLIASVIYFSTYAYGRRFA